MWGWLSDVFSGPGAQMGLIAFALAIGFAARPVADAIRAYRGKRNGQGPGDEVERPRRRESPTGATAEMIRVSAEVDALCDRLERVEDSIAGKDGLQAQVAVVAAECSETKRLVVGMPGKLAELLESQAAKTQTRLSREVFQATRSLKDELSAETDAKIAAVKPVG